MQEAGLSPTMREGLAMPDGRKPWHEANVTEIKIKKAPHPPRPAAILPTTSRKPETCMENAKKLRFVRTCAGSPACSPACFMALGHEFGILLAFFGAIAVSSDGVLVKLAAQDGASLPMIMVFKSCMAAVTLSALQLSVEPLLARMRGQRHECPRLTLRGLQFIIAGGCFSAAVFAGFTLAFFLTTSANVLAFTALAPIWTSLLTKPVLGEPLLWRTVWANLGALVGTAVVVTGVAILGEDDSAQRPIIYDVVGILVAIATGLSQASMFTTIRLSGSRAPGTPMVWASVLGMVIATLIGFALVPALHPVGEPLLPPTRAIRWLALNGCCCVALALYCVTLAVRLTPPAEVSLIMQLEGLLGPVSTFLVLNEVPSVFTLAGGGFVLACVIMHEALSIFMPPVKRAEQQDDGMVEAEQSKAADGELKVKPAAV